MQLIFNSWFFKLFYKHYWLTFYSYLYFIYLIEDISIKYFFLLICSKKKTKNGKNESYVHWFISNYLISFTIIFISLTPTILTLKFFLCKTQRNLKHKIEYIIVYCNTRYFVIATEICTRRGRYSQRRRALLPLTWRALSQWRRHSQASEISDAGMGMVIYWRLRHRGLWRLTESRRDWRCW